MPGNGSLEANLAGLPIVGAPTSVATRGVSVLGHFPAYSEKAAEIGARRFNIPPEVWARMSAAERWGKPEVLGSLDHTR